MRKFFVSTFNPTNAPQQWINAQLYPCDSEDEATEFAERCVANPAAAGTPYFIYEVVAKVQTEVPPAQHTSLRE